jgi:hypothetical protein
VGRPYFRGRTSAFAALVFPLLLYPLFLCPLFLCISAYADPSSRFAPFTLEAEGRSYLIGQPVYLRIGSGDAAPPSLEQGTMVLSIRGPDGEEAEYHPPLRFRSAPRAGGPPIRFARIIAADGGLAFRKPGRYRLRLVTPRPASAGPGRTILSDSLALDFSLPVRNADKRAFAILSRDPGEYALAVYLEGGQQLRAGMAILRELAAFPNAYRRTAAFVLSSDWCQDYLDRGSGATRPMDLEQALKLAQWDLRQGAYVPLRNAYRLQNAVKEQMRRDSTVAGLRPARDSLAAFQARLTPVQFSWFRAF